jgi:hypothetical protein
MTRSRLIGLAVLTPVVGVFGFLAHEAGHWSMGRAFGLDMYLQLNRAGPVDPGIDVATWRQAAITSAGPAVTFAQALVGVALARRLPVLGFALTFSAVYMRAVAFGISVLVNPNDEARLGEMLGIGIYPIHIAVMALLLPVLALATLRARAGWSAYIIAFVASSAAVSAVVYLDPVVGRIL